MNYFSKVIGTGFFVPETVMKNKDFESFVDTSDEWIRTRTGIEERRICVAGENTLTLSHQAALRALKMAELSPADLDLIIIGTVTPDTVMPTTANQLQALLGATKAFSFDLQAACSGFLYGLSIADQFIRTGKAKNALIIGAEMLSSIVNFRDRGTCVLFGDGAGAFVVQGSSDSNARVIDVELHSDGRNGEALSIPHGFSRVPPGSAEYRLDKHKVQMKGNEIFKLAVRNMVECSQEILKRNGFTTDDVSFFIFHQANMRIIEMCAKTLGVSEDKMWNNVNKYGNTSAATLPICFDEALKAGRIKRGDLVLMTTFGGGTTWGAGLIRW